MTLSDMNIETPLSAFKPNNFLTDLNLFIEYCNDFYNIKTGMYPVATKKEIIAAIGEYLTQPHEFEIQFDSIDREKVREILEPSYNWMGVSGGITLGPATEFTVCED
jgi:hypothetical protein